MNPTSPWVKYILTTDGGILAVAAVNTVLVILIICPTLWLNWIPAGIVRVEELGWDVRIRQGPVLPWVSRRSPSERDLPRLNVTTGQAVGILICLPIFHVVTLTRSRRSRGGCLTLKRDVPDP